jgi:hypothetical protein
MCSYYFIKWRFQYSFYSRFWMFKLQFATGNMAMSERKIILQQKEEMSPKSPDTGRVQLYLLWFYNLGKEEAVKLHFCEQ